MTVECPKCKSPVARDGQRFCYRCGHELNAYYDSLKMKADSSGASDSAASAPPSGEVRAEPTPAPLPMGTVVLEVNAFDTNTQNPPATPPKASLKILLPTGDVFDRELAATETQIGKGPRNDVVIADPAVSTAHAAVRLEGDAYLVSDLGSRNGTFVNGERVTEPRPLRHGDVIGIGLSKLTFRFSDFSETGAIEGETVAAARSSAPPPLTEESLANAVVSAGMVAKSDVDRLRADAKGRRLCRALVEERLAPEDSLRDLMSRTFQMPVIDLNKVVIDEAIVGSFPGKVAREHHVFAALKDGEATVVAVADPTDVEAVKQIKLEIRSPLSIRLATFSQIREKVDRHYGPKLIGVLPSGEKLEYLIDKNEVEIGKATHNHITLTDPTVSNTHAIVIHRDAGYSIVDLGSRNGTFINGERLGSQAHTLKHGDKVQLGQTVLTFRNPAETTANITAVLSGEALEEVRRRAGVPPLGAPKKLAEGGKQSTLESVLGPQQPAVAAATAEGAELTEEEKAEKKKKKKKKKGGDERMRAAYISGLSRIVAQVLGVVLAVMLALYVNSSMRSGSGPAVETTGKGKAKVKLETPGSGTPFQGGRFETSGAVYVPGSNGVLIVDDGRPGEVLWMQVDEAGRQVGSIKPVATGAAVDDPEGITTDGSYFYIVGSQSEPSSGDRNALVRFTFDAASQTVTKAETLTNLRDFLLSSLPELDTGLKATEGGLMIEGIAWDFRRGRWLLGLRAPLGKDGSAQLVAIKLRNPSGPFSVDNLQLAEPNVIPLKLAGLGVRDIQYDIESNSFLIISGAPENVPKSEFILWEWTGDTTGSETALRREQDLDPKPKPEGLTYVEAGGRRFVLIVCDDSAYIKLNYATESQ
jgi:pSer/pThr/pTyr-binding forkhead associated (FHA) protein